MRHKSAVRTALAQGDLRVLATIATVLINVAPTLDLQGIEPLVATPAATDTTLPPKWHTLHLHTPTASHTSESCLCAAATVADDARQVD